MAKEKKKDVTFLDDVEPRKEPESSKGELIPFEGNLPTGITQQQAEEAYKEELDRTMEGVIPRLPPVKILPGGVGFFEFPPDETGEVQKIEEFEGVLIDQHPCNAWWEESYAQTGGGVPPSCSALDGIHGDLYNCIEREIDPATGKVDFKCPHNRFGTAVDDKGQPAPGKACKNMKRLHILLDGEWLPYRLTLTAGSLGVADDFLTGLRRKNLPMIGVRLKFSLTEATNAKGIRYSRIHMAVIAKVEPQRFFEIRDLVKKYLPQIRGQEIVGVEAGENGSPDFKPEEME